MREVVAALARWGAAALALMILLSGCTHNEKYRLQADHDAYHIIDERNHDARWSAPKHNIDLDVRSRYFDHHHPDHAPMPLDDPASHEYMQVVDGKKGWKHWYDDGHRMELENPSWQEALPTYVQLTDGGAVKLDVDSALRLAYINSPNHQRQLETLYLSALDVSAERFRLDAQFFGGYDANYGHNGSLVPPQLTYSTLLNRFVLVPAIDADGLETNRLTVGRPFGANPALEVRKRYATAGELVVGFANSFVFEFTGGDVNLASSLANFSFIQPLLRGAGRDVALESLTFEERALLANLRAYSQFRQGFYTQVAIGELGVTGPQRFGPSTTLQSFGGTGGVGGYLGLLQQKQQIRNTRDNLDLQLRTLERLNALYDNELIDVVQLDQFRQSVESQRTELLVRENSLELALDNYKTSTLGLPPDLPIELDETLIKQFQLFPSEAAEVQDKLLALRARLNELPDEPTVAVLNQVLAECFDFVEPVKQLFENARKDLAEMEKVVPKRESTMDEKEKEQFRTDRERIYKRVFDLEKGDLGYDVAVARLVFLKQNLTDNTRRETLRGMTAWVGAFLQVVERLSLVPAQARLEIITVEPIDLTPTDAFQVALQNRLDFMNGRAALVDRWRLIHVNADALQSVLNLTGSGDLRTARNNPVSFRAPTGNLRMGVQFDAPLTRFLERNSYRESLIEYQRARRDFIQSRDRLHLGLRALLRNLEQLRQTLEIQRRAVTIALRRVDQTQLDLNPARRPVQPGQRPPINPTTAINLLGAQSSLQGTQNAFLSAWLSYYATRMRLYRELGVMVLDVDGRWIEYPIQGRSPTLEATPADEELPLPPENPLEVNHSSRRSAGPPPQGQTPMNPHAFAPRPGPQTNPSQRPMPPPPPTMQPMAGPVQPASYLPAEPGRQRYPTSPNSHAPQRTKGYIPASAQQPQQTHR